MGPRRVIHLLKSSAAGGGVLLALGPHGVPHLLKADAAKASRTTWEERGGSTRLRLT